MLVNPSFSPFIASVIIAATINIPIVVSSVETAGYYTNGDGGGAEYKRVGAQPSHPGYFQSNDGAYWEICSTKINVKQFGAKGDKTGDDTVAFQGAMKYWVKKFAYDVNYYPGSPGQPRDIMFSEVDRRTGEIEVPSGCYIVSDGVFSTDVDPGGSSRTPFIGFSFIGMHKFSSVLLLKTEGAEKWFYKSPVDSARYQSLYFYKLGFTSDDYRYGNLVDVWSGGGPKQFHWYECNFLNLKDAVRTRGTGNADLFKTVTCTGLFYGDILYLNNDQSVQHDYIGSDLGCYGNYIKVGDFGGGNVNVINGSIDFLYHVDFSPVGGNRMFLLEAGASVSEGNNTFKFANVRVEVQAYMRTADNPPYGIVTSYGNPQAATPRIVFDNVCFVGGETYTIDADGYVLSDNYRWIHAFQVFGRQYIQLNNCDLIKNFRYDVEGSNTGDSIAFGGVIDVINCYDGIPDQIPGGDMSKRFLLDRVSYGSTAGCVNVEGMTDGVNGAYNRRRINDGCPRWRYSFGHMPSVKVKSASFKPYNDAWPYPDNDSADYYIEFPQEFFASTINIVKPASGSNSNVYQLHLGNEDKSITYYSSTIGVQSDLHSIQASNVNFDGVGALRLWATGDGTVFQAGGTAEIVFR